MKILHPELAHATSLGEAESLQESIRERIQLSPLPRPPHRVVGCDAAYSRDGILGFSAAVALNMETLRKIEVQTAHAACTFPYVPGLFAFREVPILIESLKLLTETPDVILVDGHGIAHPQRAGLASHLGVLLDVPTIGCVKMPLGGEWREPETKPGSWSDIRMEGEVVGMVYRHRPQSQPVFLSPGHRTDLATLRELIPQLFSNHRLPEPLFIAHETAAKLRTHH